eukprot:500896-Amphidinium_carterae.1
MDAHSNQKGMGCTCVKLSAVEASEFALMPPTPARCNVQYDNQTIVVNLYTSHQINLLPPLFSLT